MTETDIYRAISGVGDDLIENSAPEPGAEQKNRKELWRKRKAVKWAAAAAGFALLILVGCGTFAMAAEAKEYNSAVRFFRENDLSTEGLTRGEIKAVYRDITTDSFTYEKTAAVIENSIRESVGGYEISQDELTPEDVEALWNYRNSNARDLVSARDGFKYKYYDVYKKDVRVDYEVLDVSVLEKYDGEKLLWKCEISNFYIEDYEILEGGILVYGQSQAWMGSQTWYAWMALINEDGGVEWEKLCDNGFKSEYIAAAVDNGDGTFAVFSRGDWNYLCLSQYDKDGNVLQVTKTEVGDYGIWDAARLEDGYIIQLGSYVENEFAKLVKVAGDGSLTDTFSYESDECCYYITDMLEYGGNVYLSAYSIPKQSNGGAGRRDEIAPVLDELFDNHRYDITDEELTPMVRSQYTALLLVCDTKTGVPREFYSVKGSLGGALACNEAGELQWDVEHIATTFFSPATSAFTIGGTSYVYRYFFGADGALLRQEKTGEAVDYYR